MGLLVAFVCAFLSSSKDLISKRLASRLDGMTSTFASFGFALPYYFVLLAILYFLGKEHFSYSRLFYWYVLARATTDVFAEGMKMYALALGDISIVSTCFAMAPLFVLVSAPLITGDQPTLASVVSLVLVSVGSLLLVYRPKHPDWGSQKKAIFLALGAAFFFGVNTCFDRLAAKEGEGTYSFVFSAFAMTFVSAVFLLPLVLPRVDRLRDLRDYQGGFWARGALETAFMSGKLYSMQELRPDEATAIMRLSLVLSILGGGVFFRERDLVRRLLAGVIILAGVFIVARMH